MAHMQAAETLIVCALAAAWCALLWSHGPVAATPAAAALAWCAQTAALPIYERRWSFRPVVRSGVFGSAVLLGLSAVGSVSTPDVRLSLGALATLLLVPLLLRVVARVWSSPRRTLLLGDRSAVFHLIAQWEKHSGVVLTGVCLADADASDRLPADIEGVPVVGTLQDAALYARVHNVQRLVVTPGSVTAYDVRRLSWALEDSDVELAIAAEAHGVVPRRITPKLVGRRLLLSVRPAHRPLGVVLVKAAADRVAAALLLALLAPLLVSLLVLVRVDSPGPGIFRQVRAGRGGRSFTMLKLRTMSVDAEQRRAELEEHNEASGLLFKLSNDPRVTRLGGFLRKTSLDELPQLWNVLRGEMSLIGPRPALPVETAQYDDWIRRRLSVRPGMTGLWQVNGRSSLSWNEAIRLDLDYVDNWTLRGDLSIAGRTVQAVLRRDGAL